MKIVCTGGRDFKNLEIIRDTLDNLQPSFVYVGDCKTGADQLVRGWCLHTGTKFEPFKADWDSLGLSAGPIRNKRMVEAAAKDGCRLLLAFPGNRGTADCVRHGRKNKMIILKVEV